MTNEMDDPLYRDPALAQFYDMANQWGADFDYCTTLAAEASSILDLGCGTGELAVALAQGRRVIGTDPAAAMLEIAEKRPGGDQVTWVQADARSLRLEERFDLVLMTGHVFQVFLTEADQRAALSTIASHLKPGARFIFDSRNPALRTWEGRSRRTTLQRQDHPQLGPIETWNESSFDGAAGVLTYENGFRVLRTDEVFSGTAQIRYTPQDELAVLIEDAGLVVEKWLGDWEGNPYHPSAKEIIPIGRLL